MIIQIFLSSVDSILMVKKHSIDYIRIIFNMMKVWYLFYSSLESIELANQILPHVIQWNTDIVDDNPLVIENEDDYTKLIGFDHLKKLKFHKNSLKNLDSLVISNNNELKTIEIEDDDESRNTGVCYNVKNVELSSIF